MDGCVHGIMLKLIRKKVVVLAKTVAEYTQLHGSFFEWKMVVCRVNKRKNHIFHEFFFLLSRQFQMALIKAWFIVEHLIFKLILRK